MTPLPPHCLRPRLLPDVAFPAYSYVPGMLPHPHSAADGHRFAADLPRVDSLDDMTWSMCIPYLLGVDLFNHGYSWEAHELWESLWHAAGRKGTCADFFKGLIQLAVVGVKIREGKPAGVQFHARRAGELFAAVESANGADACWGLSLPGLRHFADGLHSAESITERAPVVVVFDELLWPSDDAALRRPAP